MEKPKIIVQSPQVGVKKQKGGFLRRGRGFSLGEIKEVNSNIGLMRKLGLPVDTRRKSIRSENVEQLKAWFEKVKPELEKKKAEAKAKEKEKKTKEETKA
ncbi:MAG: ribosomal protein L13e [Euryarchaeota archaeon]|nr:ribosomal protein L13e [Euryarchaeota archaeon]